MGDAARFNIRSVVLRMDNSVVLRMTMKPSNGSMSCTKVGDLSTRIILGVQLILILFSFQRLHPRIASERRLTLETRMLRTTEENEIDWRIRRTR